MSINRVPIYIFGIGNHHNVMLCSLFLRPVERSTSLDTQVTVISDLLQRGRLPPGERGAGVQPDIRVRAQHARLPTGRAGGRSQRGRRQVAHRARPVQVRPSLQSIIIRNRL